MPFINQRITLRPVIQHQVCRNTNRRIQYKSCFQAIIQHIDPGIESLYPSRSTLGINFQCNRITIVLRKTDLRILGISSVTVDKFIPIPGIYRPIIGNITIFQIPVFHVPPHIDCRRRRTYRSHLFRQHNIRNTSYLDRKFPFFPVTGTLHNQRQHIIPVPGKLKYRSHCHRIRSLCKQPPALRTFNLPMTNQSYPLTSVPETHRLPLTNIRRPQRPDIHKYRCIENCI